MYYRYADNRTFNVTLDVPEGYSLSYIPKNTTIDNDLMKFTSEIKNENNQIHLTYSLFLKKMIIPKNKFDEWNSTIDKLQNIFGEHLLKKK